MADGLDRMDANSPAASLERAGRKMKDVTQYVDQDTAVSSYHTTFTFTTDIYIYMYKQNHLLEAARNLEERVLPLSTLLEVERVENSAHQKRITDLEAKLKQSEALDAQVTRLFERLGRAERNYETAASLAEKANRRAATRQEENERLMESLERHRNALKKKDEEVKKTRAALEKKETQVCFFFCFGSVAWSCILTPTRQVELLKRKLKALLKLGNQPKIRTQDPDASLLVEPPIKVSPFCPVFIICITILIFVVGRPRKI